MCSFSSMNRKYTVRIWPVHNCSTSKNLRNRDGEVHNPYTKYTRGTLPVARRKKEDIPLAESDVIRHFRSMECLLFFFSPKCFIYWWLVDVDFGMHLCLLVSPLNSGSSTNTERPLLCGETANCVTDWQNVKRLTFVKSTASPSSYGIRKKYPGTRLICKVCILALMINTSTFVMSVIWFTQDGTPIGTWHILTRFHNLDPRIYCQASEYWDRSWYSHTNLFTWLNPRFDSRKFPTERKNSHHEHAL